MNQRFGGQSSPWASGAPPMYGHNNHAPPPPPQYGTPAYGHSSAPWNVSPQMRSNAGGWGAPAPPPIQHMQPQQRRPGFNMRPQMSGPTGKRGNQGWDGPPNKRFNNKGGRGGGGGQGGGNWRQGGGNQNKQNRNFNNRNQNRNNTNNRELNRNKQNETQLERRQQHDLAQKAAESLENKEYPIEATVKSDDDKNKNQDIDSAQEKYLLAVFGYVCQVCSVFLKDKSARFDHCQTTDHMTKFNSAEEERVKKEETDKKGGQPEAEVNNEQNKVNESLTENSTPIQSESAAKTEINDNQTAGKVNDTKPEGNDKSGEEPKESVEKPVVEEIKSEEKAVIDQPNEESADKTSDSKPPAAAPEAPVIPTPTPTPVLNSQPPPQPQPQPQPQPTQPAKDFSGQDFNQNRGRGYQRGRGGNQGGRGRGGGRGRNRGRGRK